MFMLEKFKNKDEQNETNYIAVVREKHKLAGLCPQMHTHGSVHFGRLRQADLLSSGVRDQPGQNGKTHLYKKYKN